MNKDINIFYWNKRENFGDVLASRIMSYYGADNIKNIYNTDYTGDYISPIGSVLHFAPRKGLHVFGSGFMSSDKLGSKTPPKEVIALRGPLSESIANDLGWQAPKALGDTGLLVSRIYPKEDKAFRLGVVLHYAHALDKIPNLPGVIFINPQNNVDRVIKEIASCEKVVSSSLHGLIVAHSFNIPWVRLKVVDHQLGGGDFKFNDFYGSIGCDSSCEIECSVQDLKRDVGFILDKAKNIGVSEFSGLKKKQIELESAFYNSCYFKNVFKPLL